jgi:hypothetical protein
MSNVVMTILCTYHDQSPNLDLIWLNAINEAASVAKKVTPLPPVLCRTLRLSANRQCRSLLGCRERTTWLKCTACFGERSVSAAEDRIGKKVSHKQAPYCRL